MFRRADRIVVLIMAAAAALGAFDADAAVRRCGQIVSSEIVTAPTELEAKKGAMDQWRAKALKHGTGFDSWRLAHTKSLTCHKNGDAFECVAFGGPCIIDQSPATPLKPPGQGI